MQRPGIAIGERCGLIRWMRNAVLFVLFILGSWASANADVRENKSRDKITVIAVPVFSFLPTWALHREMTLISREDNASVLKSAFEVFNPSLISFLQSVPIVLDASANTAKAYPEEGYIGVSPDWDNTVLDSQYKALYAQRGMKPGDPVFMHRFKTGLLIHEFLHILQFHLGIDNRVCYAAVKRWYLDPRYGIPSPNGSGDDNAAKSGKARAISANRVKYIVWHHLYNYRRLSAVPQDESWKNMQYGERYQFANKGVEEFAYIGEEILAGGTASENYIKTGQWRDTDWTEKQKRLLEASPEVIALFGGIFNPRLMQRPVPNQALQQQRERPPDVVVQPRHQP